MAAARRRIDWNCYTPLTPGESLQARSIVEAEAFENIEAEARRQRHLRLREQLDEPVTEDIDTVRLVWGETVRELIAAAVCGKLKGLRAAG